MCGIGGVIGDYNKEEIFYLLKNLYFRGPDNKSTIFNKKYGCAFTRLSIIDQKKGNQPFYNTKNNAIIFVNGEIYNSFELSNALKQANYKIKTKSDIEPLIYLYQKEGISFLKKLNGIYARCIFDDYLNKAYLFRDRWGVKPLYYGIDKNRIIYSSDLTSIRNLISNDNGYSKDGLSSYLINRFVKAPYTFFNNIYEVLPGELIIIDLLSGKIIKKEKYFNLSKEVHKNKKIFKNLNSKEWEELIDVKLNEAVKRQINLKNKKGIFLSGGIDSSLLLKLMSNNSSGKLNTYTLVDKSIKNNKDRNFSRKLSKTLNTSHNEVEISPKIWLKNKERALSAFGQPFSHAFSTIFITDQMKNNLKVAYSGDGADELFGNYLSHRFASSKDFVKKNDNNIEKSLLIQDVDKLLKFKNILKLNKYWRYNLYNFNDYKLIKDIYKNFNNNNYDIFKTQIDKLTSTNNLEKTLEYEMQNELPNQILEFTDKLSMINSIETRVPYLDNEFVKVALAVPTHLKINHNEKKYLQTKFILKQVASKYLGPNFINRQQNGFQINTNLWMKSYLKKDLTDIFESNILSKTLGFDKKYYNKILHRFFNGDNSIIYEVWTLYCLGSWLILDNNLH